MLGALVGYGPSAREPRPRPYASPANQFGLVVKGPSGPRMAQEHGPASVISPVRPMAGSGDGPTGLANAAGLATGLP